MQDSIFYNIILVILIIIAISVFIWAVIRWTKLFMDKDSSTPLDIAKERYAKGEITKNELDEIKKNLE
jgi:putative membrane protein